MALTLNIISDSFRGGIHVTVNSIDHTTSTLTVQRRIPPTARELDALLFISHAERYGTAVIIDDADVFSVSYVARDYAVRAGVPYQYQAREVYADGSEQPWTAWLPAS